VSVCEFHIGDGSLLPREAERGELEAQHGRKLRHARVLIESCGVVRRRQLPNSGRHTLAERPHSEMFKNRIVLLPYSQGTFGHSG
tara:strand:+ start:285 stop:539 length:255 start_codon:yes stop_codon:yes gene_type:complete